MSRKIVIFDLDGTLADITHRRHFVERPNKDKDWDSFHKACIDDKPINNMIEVYNRFISPSYRVIILSGRNDMVRKETMDWFKKHCIYVPEIRMRNEGDYTPDHELKRKWLYEIGKENVICVFDDRDRVVNMWRKEGLLCCQVSRGDF